MSEPHELASRVIAAAGEPPEPFGLYAFSADDNASELARAVERAAFDEFFGNSPELLAGEYGLYEQVTLFLCVLDHRRRRPAAMMRVVFPSHAGLKSLADLEPVWGVDAATATARTEPPIDTSRALDIATFAVDPEYRGRAANGLVNLALYQAIGQAAAIGDLRWVVTILDVRVLNLVQRSIAAPFSPLPGIGPLGYLGSQASLPVYSDLEHYFARLAAEDPSLREILADGRGIEPAVRPTVWGDALARVRPRRMRIA